MAAATGDAGDPTSDHGLGAGTGGALAGVMDTFTHIVGLGDPEIDALQQLVDETAREAHAWHRLVGLLTAVASAPSPILAGDWVEAAHAPLLLDDATREHAWTPTLRLFTALSDWLDGATAVAPPPEDGASVEAFCRGYVRGIELDRHWRESPGLLALAMPMVVLGGMRPWSDFAARYRHGDSSEAWADRARRQLPRRILDVYEAMRASGTQMLVRPSRRPTGKRL